MSEPTPRPSLLTRIARRGRSLSLIAVAVTSALGAAGTAAAIPQPHPPMTFPNVAPNMADTWTFPSTLAAYCSEGSLCVGDDANWRNLGFIGSLTAKRGSYDRPEKDMAWGRVDSTNVDYNPGPPMWVGVAFLLLATTRTPAAPSATYSYVLPLIFPVSGKPSQKDAKWAYNRTSKRMCFYNAVDTIGDNISKLSAVGYLDPNSGRSTGDVGDYVVMYPANTACQGEILRGTQDPLPAAPPQS